MTHLDLFSGIGGFAYAIDQVWDNVEHIFCDNEPFARQVLKKHWPEAYIYDDIRQITANTECKRYKRVSERTSARTGSGFKRRSEIDILTGGFPCQPYSAAGLRRGTADERHLWPEMLRVVRLTQPAWIIAENVYGLLDWNDGVVFEQVCTDLEAAGYEVQPFIIPAVAVNAPHRRYRVWFIAHTRHTEQSGRDESAQGGKRQSRGQPAPSNRDADNAIQPRLERHAGHDSETQGRKKSHGSITAPDWSRDWHEVAAEFCRVDDGVPKGLDRANQLKAYGNAIVPQVAMEILKSIKGIA